MPEISVLRTKLTPPRPPRYTLERPRVEALLRQALDYRVTIVQASTGYGKSTALASLARGDLPLFWYSASEGDADPQQFLAHLITAFRLGLPSLPETPLALLQDAYAGGLRLAVDSLLNALDEGLTAERTPSALLVIDDYHLVAPQPGDHRRATVQPDDHHLAAILRPPSLPDVPTVNSLTDHILSFLPNNLHVIISTRYAERPGWEHLVSWRARGQVLEIKRDALAFTREEIETLFRAKYALDLTAREVDTLVEKTEGWPIALQLVWQELRTKPHADVAELFGAGSETEDTLFEYLAQNVLAEQPPEVQEFLLRTCVLRELNADVCHALVAPLDCPVLLAYLIERDLFVVALDSGARVGDEPHEQFRYHHLFHDFLLQEAARRDPAALKDHHRRAAEFYRDAGNAEEAIYHFQSAAAFADAAVTIQGTGENLLRAGRLDTLAAWLDALPPEVVASHPLLMFYLGDLARLRSRFDEALAWYAQAERVWRSANDIGGISRALRGQALVYLDTVRPARAEDLLEEALRLNDGLDDRVARARLLELLAENKLNMGKAQDAEQLQRQAGTLRVEGPSEDVLSVRVKLRTGRLDQAREILEAWAREERGQMHAPRAHRETLLVLALIHAMQGHTGEALAIAQEGLALAAQLESPFVSAVGQMRLGHAEQIRGEFRAALDCYGQAVALGDQVAVRRTRAEAMWGMTRAYGYSGDLDAARRAAAEGIEIGRTAGDAWIVALIQTALGGSLVLAGQDKPAVEALGDAAAAFRSCADTFGQTAAHLWLAIAHKHLNQRERALAHLDQALALAEANGYAYLVTTRTLLGWHDARIVVPLLLEMRDHMSPGPRPAAGRHTAYAARLLSEMGMANTVAHPGYQLRVQTLGPLRVWRGRHEIAAREWQRRKARELFLLLITRRGSLVEREEIFEQLSKDEPPAVAARDFKVAMNALMQVLEPNRAANDPSAFIVRSDTAYGLRPGADLWIDAEEFSQALTRAADQPLDLQAYTRALELYQDDYLIVDARYADWAIAERERLLALYLRSADRQASELLARDDCDACIAWCERILARDRCWEHAYRLMMRAYAARGDRALARRAFEQCERNLRQELDVEPSPATRAVFQSIMNSSQ